jgi:hypothetical protein
MLHNFILSLQLYSQGRVWGGQGMALAYLQFLQKKKKQKHIGIKNKKKNYIYLKAFGLVQKIKMPIWFLPIKLSPSLYITPLDQNQSSREFFFSPLMLELENSKQSSFPPSIFSSSGSKSRRHVSCRKISS